MLSPSRKNASLSCLPIWRSGNTGAQGGTGPGSHQKPTETRADLGDPLAKTKGAAMQPPNPDWVPALIGYVPEADHVQSAVGGRRKVYVLVVGERSIADIGDRLPDNRAEEVPIAGDLHLGLGRVQHEVTAVGVAGDVDVAV